MKVLEKVIQSNTEPSRQDVVWIDTSDVQNPVVKLYVNGEWKLASSESADVQHLQDEIDEIIEELAGEGGTIEDLGEIRTKALAAVAGNGVTNVTSLTKEAYDALEEKDPETLYIVKNDPTNGHEWVDIGQVDDEGYHIVWATKNIGAETEYDDGKYFAFGDTIGYYAEEGHEFSPENAPYWDSENEEYTKYNEEDGLTELQPEDDAAHIQWGGKWEIPNYDICDTFTHSYISSQITRYNNIPYGCSNNINNNTIIIPTSGYFSLNTRNLYHDVVSEDDTYQFVSLSTAKIYSTIIDNYLLTASYLNDDIDETVEEPNYRYTGYAIRPIIRVKNLSELDPTYDIYLGENKIVDNSSKISDYDRSILDPGEEQYAYGVLIDFTQGKFSYDLTRIGNMDLHRTLPVQSQYKGCIWDLANSEIVTYLNPDDWSLATEDKTAEEIDDLIHDATKSIRVETPKFYATSKVLATDGAGNTTMAKVMFSTQKLNPWYIEIPKMVTDFRNARIFDDSLVTSTLNITDDVYGGYCTTKNDYTTAKENLLHPITNIDRSTMRDVASQYDTYVFSYDAYKWIFYWAVVIEYATLFTAKPMIQELDSNGFHQGGLGPGMTSIESYGVKYSDGRYIYNPDYDIHEYIYLGANYYQSNASDEFPLRDIGVTNNWGNRTGENIVEYTRNSKTSHVHQNRYRGFEFPFGDIMMNLDGFLGYTFKDDNDVSIAEAYFTCSNPEKFQDTLPSDYYHNDFDNGWRLALLNDKLDGFYREGYDEGATRFIYIGNNGDLFETKWFVDEYSNCDKYFVNSFLPLENNQNTTIYFGSTVDIRNLRGAGLYNSSSGYDADYAHGVLGFRCFNIIED